MEETKVAHWSCSMPLSLAIQIDGDDYVAEITKRMLYAWSSLEMALRRPTYSRSSRMFVPIQLRMWKVYVCLPICLARHTNWQGNTMVHTVWLSIGEGDKSQTSRPASFNNNLCGSEPGPLMPWRNTWCLLSTKGCLGIITGSHPVLERNLNPQWDHLHIIHIPFHIHHQLTECIFTLFPYPFFVITYLSNS